MGRGGRGGGWIMALSTFQPRLQFCAAFSYIYGSSKMNKKGMRPLKV